MFIEARLRHVVNVVGIEGVHVVPLGSTFKRHHVGTIKLVTRWCYKTPTDFVTPRFVHTGEVDQWLGMLEAKGVGQTGDFCLELTVSFKLLE